MSDAPHHHDDGPHEGPIKTPKQLVVAVALAFIVPIIAIILLVTYVAADKQAGAGSEALSAEAVAQRIRPVGAVEVKDASDPAALQSGQQVFQAVCAACHATGTLNAPKLGDAPAWAPRIAQGFQTLLASSLKGKGAMPAQGGGDFTDLEIGRAVVYMANQSGGKLPEPQVTMQPPVAAAPQAAAQPAAEVPATAAPTTSAAINPTAPAAAVTAPATAAVPALYTQNCSACHIVGVAGAPKLGDKAAWAPRIAQGIDAMTATVIKGKGAMPPKGGSTASEAEIKQVVTYMANASK